MKIQQAFELTRQHLRAGRLAEAEAIAREILAAEPRHADALHVLGVIAGQTGRKADAVDWLRQSIAIRPDHPEACKNLGVALRELGRTDEAIAAYRQAIALKPNYADAHKSLGNALYENGRLDEAVAAYRQAIALRPGHAESHSNLGAALKDQGRLDEAIASCRQAIALDPDCPDAHNNLGNALHDKGEFDDAIAAYREALRLRPGSAVTSNNLGAALKGMGRIEEAIAAFREAITRKPDYAGAFNNLGSALLDQGRIEEAVAAHRRSVELKPDSADAFGRLGHALKEHSRIEEAIAAYRDAARLEPDSPDWRHVLAALTGDRSVNTTPAGYVRSLFDSYARRFDEHLLGALQYCVPEQLLEAVTEVAPGRQFDILDLGCGTGLCGAAFHPAATSLTGVDLSPGMIAKASARGIYARLITGEIVAAMREAEKFDLILAGDLFIYVGDLGEVFRLVRHALRSGGLFAFSIERHDGEGFILHPMVRFAHSLPYIRELSRAHRLAELHVREITLRKSGPDDVAGWIVVLQKPPAPEL